LAWLAGDVLKEIGIKRVGDSAFGRDLLKRGQARLRELLEGGKLAPKERIHAADTLDALGDPRFDPERCFLPKEPNLGFIFIPAGKFIMGSNGDNEHEKPKHEIELPYDYWLAKYPVTVAQYHAFVEASGYKTTHPNSLGGVFTRPVVNVTWHDALSYCDWLSKQLSAFSNQLSAVDNPFWQGIASGSLRVTLPSEAEWEKASRGTDGRAYPWGEKVDPSLANYDETGIGGASVVGAFPGGVSHYGLLDMSGNVWEWTRSLWGKDYTLEFKYPYQLGEKSENLNAPDNVSRVLRGGSFLDRSNGTRCSYRGWYSPNRSDGYYGFRVGLVSSALLSS
jgi:formylglycine-generating enzyme required for sulfatase activity